MFFHLITDTIFSPFRDDSFQNFFSIVLLNNIDVNFHWANLLDGFENSASVVNDVLVSVSFH